MPFLKRTTRILIVDDDEDDFFITSDLIKDIEEAKFVIEWVNQYSQALNKMLSHEYDIYFVDYRLGAKTGVDLIREAIESKCEEPIILLTGKGNREIDRMAMKMGAFDYLVKSELNTEKLERTIRYALERSSYLKAIRRNERKFRNIFERSMDAVFITDMGMQFRDLNKAAIRLLNYSAGTLENKQLPDLLASSEIAEKLGRILLAGNDINDREVEVITGSGEHKYCILSASVEEDLEGVPYIQGILHDITNLKRAEWLTLQAEKLAATGRLVRTLAHEVRNPLNNITLSAEQLQLDLKDEDNQLYLEVIRRNSQRISNIISELLNSSRPSEIEPGVISLQQLLLEVLDDAQDSIKLNEVNLVANLYDHTPAVMADKNKLKIAFMNIIVNAVEAMEGVQEGRLTISLAEKDGFAITEITDSGCGMSAETMGRLFEPYYTSKRNGMGLGLASTLNIVQSHKGYIEVHSAQGKGTSFQVFLPLSTQ